ncbi:hypothetical protein PGB90_006901 [Kerria lacca]
MEKTYKIGDLVLVKKITPTQSTSRKLVPTYDGLLVIHEVLPNDRYIVKDMSDTHRMKRSSNYFRTVVVDNIKPWMPIGGKSDVLEDEYDGKNVDGVVLSFDSETSSSANV